MNDEKSLGAHVVQLLAQEGFQNEGNGYVRRNGVRWSVAAASKFVLRRDLGRFKSELRNPAVANE